MSQLWATKSVDALRAAAAAETGLKRSLGALDLVLLGIGCVIGTGIFVLTGQAAAANAGPAVSLSFLLAGTAAGLAALCYAEMAAMLPVAGSAYTYTYATMGELVAWVIGWDLILEYLVGAATVSAGWSGYVVSFLHDLLGVSLPAAWVQAPVGWDKATRAFHWTGAYLNLPATAITLTVTGLLVIGTRESARFNAAVVAIKLAVVVLFITLATPFIDPNHWRPFVPANAGRFGQFGVSGIFQGATMVFFAYIGFDAVSTAAQETRNPQRDVPTGIMVSLAVCTLLYVLVALVLTGLVPYTELGVAHPIALGVAATHQPWLEAAVDIGAIAGLSSVMLVLLMGQPRIFFAMAQDGLFPAVAARVHPRFGTPWVTTLVTGLLCALAGGLLPISILGELSSIGTLFAFVLVSLGIVVLRRTRPDLPRAFKVPGGPYWVPGLSMLASGTLMATATFETLLRLFVWMAVGLLIYVAYGRRHSHLGRALRGPGG